MCQYFCRIALFFVIVSSRQPVRCSCMLLSTTYHNVNKVTYFFSLFVYFTSPLVASLTPGRVGYVPILVHVGFVVDEVTLGRFPTKYFSFIFLSPLLHTRTSYMYH
jgi:hypothetical protein